MFTSFEAVTHSLRHKCVDTLPGKDHQKKWKGKFWSVTENVKKSLWVASHLHMFCILKFHICKFGSFFTLLPLTVFLSFKNRFLRQTRSSLRSFSYYFIDFATKKITVPREVLERQIYFWMLLLLDQRHICRSSK